MKKGENENEGGLDRSLKDEQSASGSEVSRT